MYSTPDIETDDPMLVNKNDYWKKEAIVLYPKIDDEAVVYTPSVES